jgi:hypothetical protein
MTTIRLSGRVTENGELQFEIPQGLPPGDARITIEIGSPADWSPDELERALSVEPMTGAEIVAAGLLGGWADQKIDSGSDWVERRRAERRERRGR